VIHVFTGNKVQAFLYLWVINLRRFLLVHVSLHQVLVRPHLVFLLDMQVLVHYIFVSLVDVILAELQQGACLNAVHDVERLGAFRGLWWLSLCIEAVSVFGGAVREVLLESVDWLSLVLRLCGCLASLGLHLLLILDHLIDFIDKLFPEVDLLKVLCIFSEYLKEELDILLIREFKSFLYNGWYGVVSVLIEHYISKGISFLVVVVRLLHERIENQLLTVVVWAVQKSLNHTGRKFRVAVQL